MKYHQKLTNLSHLVLGIMLFFVGSCEKQNEKMSVAEEEFSKNIRTTEARSPTEELLGFELPPGFEIQLFASEPDIGKPLNMAFDARGRMWVTQSYEYPFADTTGMGKDKITILEDTDKDGKADKFTVFADSLNIPIGILPVNNGALAYSIPNIYHFVDHNGDDQVDERKVLFGEFEYKDTHGMINNFVKGWDGWIHADHGFANQSKVAGTDGDTIVMNSGNTFRFRSDGSHIEFTTTGRVNPFGYAYDELGYTYSVDCHTNPIYQLIRGGDYPHFGKQPTGIGFAPAMMNYNHGSTALAGLEYYIAPEFPTEYQNSFYMGDVVKCRVYRNTIKMNGTTPEVTQEPDFLISEDPWFRPVDVKLGPDGALYIADFYNRIIGHYEVPLDHPGRDRQRGRIWRIIYTGNDHQTKTEYKDWSKANLEELLAGLNHPNLSLRMTIANQIADRFGMEAIPDLKAILENEQTSPLASIQAMWLLYRFESFSNELMIKMARHDELNIRVHALRIMFEYEELDETLINMVQGALEESEPHLKRAAVMILAKHPQFDQVSLLLNEKERITEGDSHLLYAIRQGLRDHFRNKEVMWAATSNEMWNAAHASDIADVLVGVYSEESAYFLWQYLKNNDEAKEAYLNYTRHVARYLPENQLDQMVVSVQNKAGNDLDFQYNLFLKIQEGIAQRGGQMSAKGKNWGLKLAENFLSGVATAEESWKVTPSGNLPYKENSWQLIQYQTKDTKENIQLISSDQMNQGHHASTLVSYPFSIPEKLSFYLAGHKNKANPNQEVSPSKNQVILKLAQTGQIIEVVEIEKENAGETVILNTGDYAGEIGYLEVTDGSDERGEFIAIGEFSPDVLKLPAQDLAQMAERQIFACNLAEEYNFSSLFSSLNQLLSSETSDILARAKAGEALLKIKARAAYPLFEQIAMDSLENQLLKQKLLVALGDDSSAQALSILERVLGNFEYQTQKEIVQSMANSKEGIGKLLSAAREGKVNPRILLERQIKEKVELNMGDNQKVEYEELTANLSPLSEETQKLIDARVAKFSPEKGNVEQGQKAFVQYCSPCHQIEGNGGIIGPQLDGIGNWGAHSLTEKILDPNRNISKAFINYSIKTKDGNIKTGLFRREEGELLVFANASGQEFSLPKKEVVEKKASPFTLMPDHFGEVIPENEYYALLSFLLSQN
ncbi:PVC-type heme-binding CxxCH protein [Flexithrix dorotheae]|uniref:PVC-type heme-binding CxxCH protein n=1 Tax=Flexithrix dorotheae TaxID=70993 RepID=UPI000A0088B8|nr:PVC-type heme-binding CxxCH protein [Flexithrix dorotheae]